ncbi:MAG: GtrA family protein [Streptosporangiales bacterium]|nr:GtrA family protein [Streptosporangiales bacterium]
MKTLLLLYGRVRHLVREALKFGTVGGLATVVDVGVFNLFRLGMGVEPLISTVISMIAATTVSYVGNRNWTFRHRGGRGVTREYVLFFFFNGVGLAITLACVGISHYMFGFTSPLADNIAKNVVGLALASLFRFCSYRTWVFPARPKQPMEVASGS